MGQNHALGGTGGPGGVHNDGCVVRGWGTELDVRFGLTLKLIKVRMSFKKILAWNLEQTNGTKYVHKACNFYVVTLDLHFTVNV